MQLYEQVEEDDIPYSSNPSMCLETLQILSYHIHKTATERVKTILIVHMSLVKKASTYLGKSRMVTHKQPLCYIQVMTSIMDSCFWKSSSFISYLAWAQKRKETFSRSPLEPGTQLIATWVWQEIEGHEEPESGSTQLLAHKTKATVKHAQWAASTRASTYGLFKFWTTEANLVG